MTSGLPLKEHQREGIEWIRRSGRGLLADEPGLGKTRQAIEAFDGGRNLVVAPGLVIEGGTWEDELEKWSRDPSKWTVVPYSQLNVFKPKGRGTAPVKALKPAVKGHWDAVVFDEVHVVKGRDTPKHPNMKSWAALEIARHSDQMLAMSGTPFPNWAHEIFRILQMISPEKSHPGGELGSFWNWAEEWFDCRPTRWSNGSPVAGELLMCSRTARQLKECLARPASDPCEHYLEFASKNLDGKYLRRWREDCLDLPPFTEQTIKTPMDAATKKAYLGLKQEFYAQYEGQEIVAWNQGSKNVQLHKLTTSPWLLTMRGNARGGKLEQLRYDLENRTRPTLVFAHYKDSVEACALVAKSLGLGVGTVHGGIPSGERKAAIASFKSGDLPVLVGSLETMAEGHTLVEADMAIFVEDSFKSYRNEQAIFRVHRMGQERPVTIRRYRTPNSVDMKKQRLLATKTDRQMRALTAAEFMEII